MIQIFDGEYVRQVAPRQEQFADETLSIFEHRDSRANWIFCLSESISLSQLTREVRV